MFIIAIPSVESSIEVHIFATLSICWLHIPSCIFTSQKISSFLINMIITLNSTIFFSRMQNRNTYLHHCWYAICIFVYSLFTKISCSLLCYLRQKAAQEYLFFATLLICWLYIRVFTFYKYIIFQITLITCSHYCSTFSRKQYTQKMRTSSKPVAIKLTHTPLNNNIKSYQD